MDVSGVSEELTGQFTDKKYGFVQASDIETHSQKEKSVVEWLIECM